ncbi:MAG: glycosyltransferase, partial [Pseudomonadota bacterium]|nr:glycosyltransferase [Pseudomonadota bacterium]
MTADLSVAVYLYQPGDGGLDRVAILLANHMARRGMKVELWMARTQGVSAHLIDPRVPVRRVAALRGQRRLSMIGQYPALSAMVRRHRPDILYSAGNQSNMLVALACAGTQTRSVLCSAGDASHCGQGAPPSVQQCIGTTCKSPCHDWVVGPWSAC